MPCRTAAPARASPRCASAAATLSRSAFPGTTDMTTLSVSLTHDRRSALWAAPGFVLALALASQIAVPMPGTPVPLTLQPLVIVLAGMGLGPVVGAGAMIAYLALGAAGLPVFAPVGA